MEWRIKGHYYKILYKKHSHRGSLIKAWHITCVQNLKPNLTATCTVDRSTKYIYDFNLYCAPTLVLRRQNCYIFSRHGRSTFAFAMQVEPQAKEW